MGRRAARAQVTDLRPGAALVVGAILAGAVAQADPACRPDLAELRWDGGQARFSVEVADTEAERAKGLMNRDRLPMSAGMLFVYKTPQAVAFWMRDTRIPLDMLFLDGAGRVLSVHANAIPGDETTIPGPDGTQYVLEINGGLARRLGIAAGAEMRQPAISQQGAAWPCAN